MSFYKKVKSAKHLLLTIEYKRAKRAINFLRYGAPSYQKTELKGCYVKNAASAYENSDAVEKTIASWVEKGLVAGPFNEPPVKTVTVTFCRGIVMFCGW